ncbi:hypothetical protein VNO78_23115 [Psophocarpus tetragonolobus]|uniref:Uncharacterized protein n=1 Tax=Psophocarpus tetragonolobus TaxID=3891 RepID=A0AAN9S4A1_PSOTE
MKGTHFGKDEGTHSQMSGKDEATHGKEKVFNESNVGGVIFFLNNLPIRFHPQVDDDLFLVPQIDDHSEVDDDVDGVVPSLPVGPENIGATFFLPLKRILSSKLNLHGFIRAIYVNFGPMGYYKVKPNTRLINQLAAFQTQLSVLFQYKIISNPDNREEVWWTLTNLPDIVSNLPANCRKIGCMDGEGYHSQGSIVNYRDYISAASDEQTYVFVVGEIDTEIQAHIDDFVKVSDYDLVATESLNRVISTMEIKWGIF